MEIGKPRKVHKVEPLRDPVPREEPLVEPAKPERVPAK
jgi:hypothetical protein